MLKLCRSSVSPESVPHDQTAGRIGERESEAITHGAGTDHHRCSLLCGGRGRRSRWLPDLDAGTLGTIAFFVVCGLCGAVVAIVGIEIDAIVRETRHTSGEFVGVIVTSRLALIMADGGMVAGLALIAYLLAPKPPREAAPPTEATRTEHP